MPHATCTWSWSSILRDRCKIHLTIWVDISSADHVSAGNLVVLRYCIDWFRFQVWAHMTAVASYEGDTKTAKTISDCNSAAQLDLRWSLLLHKTFGQIIPREVYMTLEHSGNGILWLLVAPAIWLLAPIQADTRHCLANFFVGLWVDLALVGSLKAIFRRPRPEYNYSGDFVLVVSVDKFSFPSGHAARQAISALLLFERLTTVLRWDLYCLSQALLACMEIEMLGWRYCNSWNIYDYVQG